MFIRKEEVEIPIGTKILVPYCRECRSVEVETIKTCKKCGSHNVATPFVHNYEDYREGIGVQQETKKETRHIYKCDICGKEFDGMKTDNYVSYADGEFERCNYKQFSDWETTEYTNYSLPKDLCEECKKKLATHLRVKLIDFTRERNINEIIKEYIEEKIGKEE